MAGTDRDIVDAGKIGVRGTDDGTAAPRAAGRNKAGAFGKSKSKSKKKR